MKHKAQFRIMGRTLFSRLSLALLCCASTFAPLPCHAQAPNPPAAKEPARQAMGGGRANYIVGELDTLSGSAVEIFTQAQANKMDRVTKKLDSLKKNVAAFEYIQEEASTILLPRLGHTIADLEGAIAAKNRIDTMRYANRITLIAATVAVPFKPCLPTEVSLLDYNGRELEIWSEVKKTEKLSGIVIRMHLAWQTLMPKLVEQNSTRELRRFSDIMGHLELAKSPEEYGRLSRQVLAETEVMKSIFVKPR